MTSLMRLPLCPRLIASCKNKCFMQPQLFPVAFNLCSKLHKKDINTGTSFTNYSTSSTKVNEWTTIYRLPLIRWAAAFNRLKIYQGILTFVGTPAVFALEQTGAVSSHATTIVAAVGISGLATLMLTSIFVQNLVGFIYINQTVDKIKLAYVDYWGRRKEAIFDVDDLMPMWEPNKPTFLNMYKLICLRSDKKQKFKLLRKYGLVDKPNIFSNLFME